LKTLKDLNFTGMDIETEEKESLLKILEMDSLFLMKHDLIDYSMLLTVTRKLKLGETEEDVKNSALQQDEQGNFILRRISNVG